MITFHLCTKNQSFSHHQESKKGGKNHWKNEQTKRDQCTYNVTPTRRERVIQATQSRPQTFYLMRMDDGVWSRSGRGCWQRGCAIRDFHDYDWDMKRLQRPSPLSAVLLKVPNSTRKSKFEGHQIYRNVLL